MKHWQKLGIALVLIGTTAAIYTRLPKTHELAHIEMPLRGTVHQHIVDYNWINASTLLTFQDWSGTPIPSNTALEAFVSSTANDKSSPLLALNNLLQGEYSDSILSPDGLWLLSQKTVSWGREDNEGAPENAADVISVAKLDGSCYVAHKMNMSEGRVNRTGWLDNRHYVLCSWNDTVFVIHIYDVNNRGFVKTVSVHDPQATIKALIHSTLTATLTDPQCVTTSTRHLLLIGSVTTEAVTVCDVDLNLNPALVQQKTISLPKGAMIENNGGDIAPSPDGKRIAWILHFRDRYARAPNFWEQFWTIYIRHQARLLPVGIPTEEIWVSGINGRGMHQIAYQLTPEGFSRIGNMKWTVDGKSLNFMQYSERAPDDASPIYTIPMD